MNLFILTVSLALFGLLFFSGFLFISAPTNVSLTYEDPMLGFRFQYPAQWKYLLERDLEGNGVHFSPLPTYPTDHFADLLIYTSDNQGNKTLEQYLHEFILEQFCCIDNQSLKYNVAKLSGMPSISASWSLTDENDKVHGKSLLTFAIKDGIAYVIHYDANLETFASWLPEVKSLINSFQFVD